jgi:hypothetical protein
VERESRESDQGADTDGRPKPRPSHRVRNIPCLPRPTGERASLVIGCGRLRMGLLDFPRLGIAACRGPLDAHAKA